MSVKQPAHRRCSKAVSSFILLPGTKIKEGKSLELQEYWGIPASFEMSLVSPGRFSPSAFRPEPPSPQPTSRCHLACQPAHPHPQNFQPAPQRVLRNRGVQVAAPPGPASLASAADPARDSRPGAPSRRGGRAGPAVGSSASAALRGPLGLRSRRPHCRHRPSALPAPPASRARAGSCGSAPRRERSSRALRARRLPRSHAPAGPEPGSSARQTPPPAPPASGPPGGGVSLGARPLPARPVYMCHRAPCPPARPPTYLPAAPEGALAELRTRRAAQGLSLFSLSPHLAGRLLTRVPRGLRAPFSVPSSLSRPGHRNPAAAAAATA